LQVEFTSDEETSPNAGLVAWWSISVPPPPPPPRPPPAAALTCPESSVCVCSPSSGTSSGTISDGPSDYEPKSGISNCQWLIASTGSVFSLRFTVFDVETFVGDYGDYVDIRRCKTSACTVAFALCLMSYACALCLMSHAGSAYACALYLMLPLHTSSAFLHLIQIQVTVA
jgi:hypothetical protein